MPVENASDLSSSSLIFLKFGLDEYGVIDSN